MGRQRGHGDHGNQAGVRAAERGCRRARACTRTWSCPPPILAEDFMKEPPPVPSAMGPDDEIAWKNASSDGDNPFVKVIEDLIARINFSIKDVSAILKSRDHRYQLTFSVPEVDIQDASDDQTMRRQLICQSLSISDPDGTVWTHTGESTGLTICVDVDRHINQVETELVCENLELYVTPAGMVLLEKVMSSLQGESPQSSSNRRSPGSGFGSPRSPDPTSSTRRSVNWQRSGMHRMSSAWAESKMSDTMYASAMSYNNSTASFYTAGGGGGPSMAASTYSTQSHSHLQSANQSVPVALKTSFLLQNFKLYAALSPQISRSCPNPHPAPRLCVPEYEFVINLTSLFACERRPGRWEITASSFSISERAEANDGRTGKRRVNLFDSDLPDSDFQLTADGRLWVSSDPPPSLWQAELEQSFGDARSPSSPSLPDVSNEQVLKISLSTDGISISLLPVHLRLDPAIVDRAQSFLTAVNRASETGKHIHTPSQDNPPFGNLAGSPLSQISDPLEFLMEDLESTSSPSPRAEYSGRGRGQLQISLECPLLRLWVEQLLILDLRSLFVHLSPKGCFSAHCKDIAMFLRRSRYSQVVHANPGMAECIAKISGKGEDRPGLEMRKDAVFGGNWALEMPKHPSPGIRLDLPYVWLRLTRESTNALKSIKLSSQPSQPSPPCPTYPSTPSRLRSSDTQATVFSITSKEFRITANCAPNTSVIPPRAHDYEFSLTSFHVKGFSTPSSFSMSMAANLLHFSESGQPIFAPSVTMSAAGESPMGTLVFRKDATKDTVFEVLLQKTEWNLRPCRSAILAMWKDIALLFKDPAADANDSPSSAESRSVPPPPAGAHSHPGKAKGEPRVEFFMDFVDCHIRCGKCESRAELLLALDKLEVSLSSQAWDFDVGKAKGFLVEDTRRLDTAVLRRGRQRQKSNLHISSDAFFRHLGYLKAFTAIGVKVHVIPPGMNAIQGAGFEIAVSNEALNVEVCSDSLDTLAETLQFFEDIKASTKAPTKLTVVTSAPAEPTREFDLTQSIDEDTFRIRHSTVDESHMSASSIPPVVQAPAPVDPENAPDFFDVPTLEMDANRRPSNRFSSMGSGSSSPAAKRDATFLLDEDNDLEIHENFFVVPTKDEASSDAVAIATPFDFRLRLDGCNFMVRLFEGLDWVHEDLKSNQPRHQGMSLQPSSDMGMESPDAQDYFEVPEYGIPEKPSGPRTKNSVQIVASGIRGMFTTWEDSRKRSPSGSLDKKNVNPTISTNTFRASTVSRLSLEVQDLEIIDDVSTSTWKKFATRYRDVSSDVAARPMLSVELSGIRVSPEHTEYRLNVSMVPLRFNIDQDALVVLLSFIPTEASREQDIFFQHVVIDTILLRIDYKPKHLNYKQLRHGNFLELLNFFSLEGAMMTLRQVKVSGVQGSRLGKEIVSRWIPSIKAGNVVEGVGAVRNLKNIGKGMVDLVLVPIDQYMKHGRIVTGLQRGAQTFAWTAVEETLDLTARLAVGTHVLLEHADEILNTGNAVSFGTGMHPSGSPSHSRQDIAGSSESLSDYDNSIGSSGVSSKYSTQPGSLKEGISEAWKVLGRTIVAMPTEVSDGRQVIKAVPVAVLRPMIGATEAVSKALLGMRNSVNPKRKLDIEDVSSIALFILNLCRGHESHYHPSSTEIQTQEFLKLSRVVLK